MAKGFWYFSVGTAVGFSKTLKSKVLL